MGQRVATLAPAVGGSSTPLSVAPLARGAYLLVYPDARVSLRARCVQE